MNKVILTGRLTRDPDVRYSNRADGQNTVVSKYTLAVDRRIRQEGGQQADFIPCIAFGNNGTFAERYLHQGMKISVVGRIQTGSYLNRDGQKVYTTDVIVEEQYFCEGKGAAGRSQQGQQQTGEPKPANDAGEGFMHIPEGYDQEGLPFA